MEALLPFFWLQADTWRLELSRCLIVSHEVFPYSEIGHCFLCCHEI